MKRLTAITIGLLLAAGTATIALADHWYYEGSASGECEGHYGTIEPFVPWCGDLRYGK